MHHQENNKLALPPNFATFRSKYFISNHPPKIIWVRSQIQTTKNLYELLNKYEDSVKDFLKDQSMACLEIIHRE